MTLGEFLKALPTFDNNVSGVKIFDRDDMGEISLSKDKKTQIFYIGMIRDDYLSAKINEFYINDKYLEITVDINQPIEEF